MYQRRRHRYLMVLVVAFLAAPVAVIGSTSAGAANPAPTVTSVSPNYGPDSGGTQVTISGTNFIDPQNEGPGSLSVDFGGVAATIDSDSATSISVTSPPGTDGDVDVTVTNPLGTSAVSSDDEFTYSPLPAVTAVSPNNGPAAGGTVVTIAGTNLVGPMSYGRGTVEVYFGDEEGNVESFTQNSILVVSPPRVAGPTDVTVENPVGTSATTAADEFTYNPAPPVVTSISPDSGPIAGGTDVTITGTGFVAANYSDGPVSVDFGSVAASNATYSDTSISVPAPPGAAGTVDVTVTNGNGTSAVSSADQFTYTAPGSPPTPPPVTTTPTTTAGHGYWLVGSDGGIFSFGAAQFYGSTGALTLQRPVVGITPTANDEGYWLVASDGGIFSFGNAGFYGSIPGIGLSPAGSASPARLNAPIVGMVPTADGGGYFMVGSDGGVFTFGDAKFEGSCPGIGGCAGAAVAVVPDASGNGYWLVTTTGHVYAFGDAINYGAPGTQSVPVTAAVRTRDGLGYWILFANGAVESYGDATNYGDPVGSVGGFNPATAIFTTSDGGGYWVAAANGSIFSYGDAPYEGDMAGVHLNGLIIAGTGW